MNTNCGGKWRGKRLKQFNRGWHGWHGWEENSNFSYPRNPRDPRWILWPGHPLRLGTGTPCEGTRPTKKRLKAEG
jgi:hypothetical protein